MKKVTIKYKVDGVEYKESYTCEETYEALLAWEQKYLNPDSYFNSPPVMLEWEWEDI